MVFNILQICRGNIRGWRLGMQGVFVPGDGEPLPVFFKLPISEISEIDDHKSVRELLTSSLSHLLKSYVPPHFLTYWTRHSFTPWFPMFLSHSWPPDTPPWPDRDLTPHHGQIVTLRLSYKLSWPEARMEVNMSADWGEEGEINISPDNIEVGGRVSD